MFVISEICEHLNKGDRMTEDRNEFLRSRMGGMGGTDMATLLGIAYGDEDALDLYYEKTRPFEPENEGEQTIHQLRGHVTEPTGAELYWGHTGRTGRKAPEVVVHQRDTGVLDIKCPISMVFGKIVDKGIRQSELVQMQTYLAVARRPWGSLGYCNLEHNGGPILSVDVRADPKLGKFLLELGQRFWDEHVLTGTPPDPEEWKVLGKEDTPPVLERSGALFTIEMGEHEEIVAKGLELLDATSLRKRGETLEKAAKKAMKEMVEESFDSDRVEVADLGGSKFTIVRMDGRKSFRQDTLRAAKPIDRDKLRVRLMSMRVMDRDKEDAEAAVEETLTALELDIDAFVKVGNPSSHIRATDRRPETDDG